MCRLITALLESYESQRGKLDCRVECLDEGDEVRCFGDGEASQGQVVGEEGEPVECVVFVK